MTILLMILKVIGIILLVILGILLFGALLILFVPVRYQAQGTYQDSFRAKGQATWLLHLLSVRFSFEDGFHYSVKIAGIPFLPGREKKPDADAGQKKAPDAAPAVKTAEAKAPDETAAKRQEETGTKELQEETAAEIQAKDAAEPQAPDGEGGQDAASTGQEEDSGTDAGFLEKLLQKVYAIFRKNREKYEAICAKIKQVKNKLSHYVRILKREETKALLRLIIGQLSGIIRHVLPRKLDVRLRIGTGDPASTGRILALQGMLYPVIRDKVAVIPDFEEKHLEGTFYMKGRITAFVVLVCALRVIINKNFRQLIRILRKKEEA